MQHKRLFVALALSAQTTIIGVPVYAQVFSDDVTLPAPDVSFPSDLPGTTPDISVTTTDLPIPSPDVTYDAPSNLPGGLPGTIIGILGDSDPTTINKTQQKILKVYEYGQKAYNVYQLGRQIYDSVAKVVRDPDGVLKNELLGLLSDYNKIGTANDPGYSNGGSPADTGPISKIFDDPQTPAESYIQAKNDVARRMYVPSLMNQLVFGEDAIKLREQQFSQLEDSIKNSIEASQTILGLSGATDQAVSSQGALAEFSAQETTRAQGLKSSQAVLKSLSRSDQIQSQQTATNGVILGNIQNAQGEQTKATLGLVVTGALAHHQRDVSNHQLASQSVFLEQIRADLGQQEDDRKNEKSANLRKQRNTTYNIQIPSLVPTYPTTTTQARQ